MKNIFIGAVLLTVTILVSGVPAIALPLACAGVCFFIAGLVQEVTDANES